MLGFNDRSLLRQQGRRGSEHGGFAIEVCLSKEWLSAFGAAPKGCLSAQNKAGLESGFPKPVLLGSHALVPGWDPSG